MILWIWSNSAGIPAVLGKHHPQPPSAHFLRPGPDAAAAQGCRLMASGVRLSSSDPQQRRDQPPCAPPRVRAAGFRGKQCLPAAQALVLRRGQSGSPAPPVSSAVADAVQLHAPSAASSLPLLRACRRSYSPAAAPATPDQILLIHAAHASISVTLTVPSTGSTVSSGRHIRRRRGNAVVLHSRPERTSGCPAPPGVTALPSSVPLKKSASMALRRRLHRFKIRSLRWLPL